MPTMIHFPLRLQSLVSSKGAWSEEQSQIPTRHKKLRIRNNSQNAETIFHSNQKTNPFCSWFTLIFLLRHNRRYTSRNFQELPKCLLGSSGCYLRLGHCSTSPRHIRKSFGTQKDQKMREASRFTNCQPNAYRCGIPLTLFPSLFLEPGTLLPRPFPPLPSKHRPM